MHRPVKLIMIWTRDSWLHRLVQHRKCWPWTCLIITIKFGVGLTMIMSDHCDQGWGCTCIDQSSWSWSIWTRCCWLCLSINDALVDWNLIASIQSWLVLVRHRLVLIDHRTQSIKLVQVITCDRSTTTLVCWVELAILDCIEHYKSELADSVLIASMRVELGLYLHRYDWFDCWSELASIDCIYSWSCIGSMVASTGDIADWSLGLVWGSINELYDRS